MSKDVIFIKEHEVYKYFIDEGISVPRHLHISDISQLNDSSFSLGEKVVLKGIADRLWHKSDEGALFFESFDEQKIASIIDSTKVKLQQTYPDLSFLLCEKIDFAKHSSLPSEAFISFKMDASLGMTLNFGFGGLHAELWASNTKDGINQWALGLTTPEEAFKDFTNHLMGQIWLGKVRQGKRLTDEKKIKIFFECLWKLGKKLEKENIELLEVNPLVLSDQGIPTVLDGVGLKRNIKTVDFKIIHDYNKLLRPEKIAIAGVSEKDSSFGKKILENLIKSEVSHDNIKIIKPKTNKFMGINCYEDVTSLKNDPVDILILALPAPIAVKLLTDLINLGGGADYVYIVAGGIGDGADKDNFAGKIKDLLYTKRQNGKWTPGIIGPNSLGIILSPRKINSLFISPDRLPITFYENGNTALISQSGAFLITRLSSENKIPLKYGFAIGSQLDLKASDLLYLISKDPKIKTFGLYCEGFESGDAIIFAKLAKELVAEGRDVVLYKGGRSESGMEAASGHTGAMAGDYDLLEKVLKKTGIIITNTMEEFTNNLLLLSSYPTIKKSRNLGIISNAGFEAVSCADHFGDTVNIDKQKMLQSIKHPNDYKNLFDKYKLSGLVSPSNPLDLTPMASEIVFLKSVELMVKDYDIVVMSIVPLTEMVATFDENKVLQFAQSLAEIRDDSQKAIIVVVDSGELYDNYRQAFIAQGFPVFNAIERPMIVLNKLFQ